MPKIRILLFVIIGLLPFIGHNDAFADCDGWFSFSSQCDIEPPYCSDGKCTLSGGLDATKKIIGDNITSKPISQYIQDVVRYLLGFISIIAVIYVIYAGFQLMIGGGDEEKMKKARQIIIYVIGGIVIMWLAYAIVSIVLETISKTAGPTQGRTASQSWSIIPKATAAAYTENDSDTFREYQNRLRIAIQNLESEFKINNSVSTANVQNIKSLVQSAFDRLPDVGNEGVENDTAKRSVDTYLELAIKNPSSNTHVSNAISKVAAFIDGAKISAITGDISANPLEGNAPLTVSFRATNIKDPSGTTPDANNYIWWTRGNGGVRRELGRGATLVYTFTQEGTYTVFLDVVSGSRNSKGRIDVLPLSVSKQIEVKPRLGEIVLLVNGVNVSNVSSLKINPTIGRMGLILDATASRATGGSITDTVWDFGNENTITYRGAPIVERQIYGNQGNYTVKINLKTNDGQTFTKELQLIVRDPSAVIQVEKETAFIGEEVNFSALSYFTNVNNVEYSWQIQDENNKKVLKSGAGNTMNFTFPSVGKYIVSLTARSPNGNIDSDSRVITVESRNPTVNLESPKSVSTEKPNTFVFDARKSYDPDTMSKNGLTYTWRLDGQKIELENSTDNGAYGEMKFSELGNHTISVTVANAYGKVATAERSFDVTSTLSLNMLITPSVAPIGTIINFIGQGENADFFEWNMGDGTPIISGNKKVVQHIFNRTGIYTVTLTATTARGEMKNQIQRKVYVTDSNSPFAMIQVNNGSSSVFEDINACGNGAMVINRSEATTLDASKSLNVDGTNADLSYTWNYFGKVKTTPSLSEKFTDIGCFPIKLTVRSNKNGATHTSTQYVSIKNTPPEITSISTNVDSSKKDSQKVLVKVTANGAQDLDGVITSYIWYYTTESDKEPQNIQITQKSDITFVLPNITEKYYFGVILEDNDGARTNSMTEGSEQTPLILDNQNGNIYMPLIALSTPKNGVLAGEKVFLSAEAKTIVGTNITKNAEYAWDFDGDGKIDERSTSPSVEHIYKNSGTYNLKVRVTYNGVSNTKYGTIYVRNALKAKAIGYQLPNGDITFVNVSSGPYDKALWNIDSESTESLYTLTLASGTTLSGSGTVGKLTVSSNETDISTVDISLDDISKIETSGTGVNYQSFPKAEKDTIRVASSTDKVLISLFGNSNVTSYAIDTDTRIDSDLDGIGENDKDNEESSSYADGGVFAITDFANVRTPSRDVKITLFEGNTPVKTKIVTLMFDFMAQDTTVSGEGVISVGTGGISTFDREQLEALAELIRSTDGTDRVALMKEYNILIENWDDAFSKTKSLLSLQELIDTTTLPADKKSSMTQNIDALLVGGAASTDEVTLAATVIEGLITSSANKTVITEKLTSIRSHPNLLEENKKLAKEILGLIKDDTSIEDKYKIHIKNQLLIILNGGQASVPSGEVNATEGSSMSGILGFISGVVKIFFLILGIILLVILIGYIFYRLSRKNDDIGFQDFLIDSVFHSRKEKAEIKTEDGTNILVKNTPQPTQDILATEEKSQLQTKEDPLKSFVPERVETKNDLVDPLLQEGELKSQESQEETVVPDWLKSPVQSLEQAENPLSPLPKNESLEKGEVQAGEASIPDWLKVPTSLENEETPKKDGEIETTENTTKTEEILPLSFVSEGELQDTLVNMGDIRSPEIEEQKVIPENQGAPSDTLPDWLVDSIKPAEESKKTEGKVEKSEKKENKNPPKTPKEQKKENNKKDEKSPTTDTSSLPDWLK